MAIDENGVVTFTPEEQAKVNEIVTERLSRAKAEKPSDYDDLKEIEKELESFGYQGTPAEKKAAIKAYKAEIEANKELEELQKEAQSSGKDPELLQAIKKLEKKIESLEGERTAQQQAADKRKQADEAWNSQVREMEETHPDVDLETLSKDAKFLRFAKGKTLPLKELYEDYVELVGDTQAEALLKDKSKEIRSTSSGKSQGSDGGTHGLSEGQKRVVDQWNDKNPDSKMTYKEYAATLKNII